MKNKNQVDLFTGKIDNSETYLTNIMEADPNWECQLFGMKHFILKPTKNDIPNWFWRKMQYIILGNKWIRKEGK